MKARILVIPVLLVLLGTSACKKADIGQTSDCFSPSNPSPEHPKAAAMQAIIDEYLKKGLPGISLSIENADGNWVGSGGFASLEDNIEFEPCHVSKAASITKFMLGTLVFKLMETPGSGLTYDDLNKPISTWIDKDIISQIENASESTLKDCMQHTTGIYDLINNSNFYLAVLNNPNKQWTQTELLKYAYHQKSDFAHPGDTAIYSNTNTIFVSMVIEKATGVPHDKLLRDILRTPLGMDNTYYQGREPLPSFTAQGYYDLYNREQLSNVSNLITGSGNGYGGMFSNVYDLKKFIDAVIVEQTFLSQRSLDSMMQWSVPDGINNYGVGIMKKFNTRGADFGIGHSGRDVGYSADLFYFPNKQFTIIFFVNYGTDGNSFLKTVFLEFESRVIDEMLK